MTSLTTVSISSATAHPHPHSHSHPLPLSKFQNKWLSLVMDQRLRDELSSVIENDDLAQLKSLVEKKPKLAFTSDEDGLHGFDLAIILDRRKVLDWFLLQNATYSELLGDESALRQHITSQLQQVAAQIVSLTATVFRKGDSSNQLSGKSFAKTLRQLETRNRRLKKMQLALDSLSPPAPPAVHCSLWSSTTLRVSVQANPRDLGVTMYCRIEISSTPFDTTDEAQDALQIFAIKTMSKSVDYDVNRLQIGKTYHVRAHFFNLAGWGNYGYPQPSCYTMSSWREVALTGDTTNNSNNNQSPSQTSPVDVDNQFACFTSDMIGVFSLAHRSKNKKKDISTNNNGTPSLTLKSIANSVYSVSKYTKNLKHGVFVAFACYNDNKLVTTNDDCLPIVCVDENATAVSMESEMQQVQKYMLDPTVLWLVTKSFSKMSLPASLELRFKILNVLADFLHQITPQIENATPMSDFVSCFFERVFANAQQDACLVVCCLHFYDAAKCTLPSGTKWTHIGKLVRKKAPINVSPEPSGGSINSSNSLNCDKIGEDEKIDLYALLTNAISEIALFTRQFTSKLPAGLHVGYLQARSSFTQMRVLATREPHAMLPAAKVRDSSHVSKEEFSYLLDRCLNSNSAALGDDQNRLIGRKFRHSLLEAISKLIGGLSTSGVDAAAVQEPKSTQLYLSELVEMDERTTLLLLVPAADSVCTMSSFKWKATDGKSPLCEISLNNFEFITMQLYGNGAHRRTVSLYNACELAVQLLQHFQRSLMSADDVTLIKQKVEAFQRMQSELETALKAKRWLVRIIGALRDRSQRSTLRLLPIENLQTSRLTRSNTARMLVTSAPLTAESSTGTSSSVRRRRRPSSVMPRDRASASASDSGNGCEPLEELRLVSTEHPDWWHSINTAAVLDFDTPLPTFASGTPARSEPSIGVVASTSASTSVSASASATSRNSPASDEPPKTTAHRKSISAGRQNGVEFPEALTLQSQQTKVVETPENLQSQQPINVLSTDRAENGDNVEQTLRIRVKPAYDIGLTNCSAIHRGVKVLINRRTTARDVVNVVIRYLNQYSHLHNPSAPFYGEDEIRDFCLVVVSGQREHTVRDDFYPLLLEKPWIDGNFYVRQRRDILAAFQCGPETLV